MAEEGAPQRLPTMANCHHDGDDGDQAKKTVVHYGGWKVMPYVIGNEAFEKLGSLGTMTNLLVYLTAVFHMQSATAAIAVNLFNGTCNLTPLIAAFLTDTHFGRYATLGFASVSTFLGMLVLTLTSAVPGLHPPACAADSGDCAGPTGIQVAVLVLSFFLLVVGAGGIRACNLAFGADQFDPNTVAGRRGISSFFNWYYFSFTLAMMVASTIIIYVQSSISWPIGLAIPAGLMFISCFLFFVATRMYVMVRPEGSPFACLLRVLVAAVRKWRLPAPAAPEEMYDPPQRGTLVSKIAHTNQFRCLDKAAVLSPSDKLNPDGTPANPWALCPLQNVEAAKCIARILPVWLTCMIYFIADVQLSTYTVFQAEQSNRRLGTAGFEIPPGSFVVFSMVALTIWIIIYDRLLVPLLRRVTGKEGGITMLQRIGLGFPISVLTMIVAALVEQKRRRDVSTMSCLWLVPQLVLIGVAEGFTLIGQVEFYYRQFPENMRSMAGALFFLGLAMSNYASGLIVSVVHRATSWLDQDLNRGKLDYVYLLSAGIGVINLCYFVACAKWYRYKDLAVESEVAMAEEDVKEKTKMMHV